MGRKCSRRKTLANMSTAALRCSAPQRLLSLQYYLWSLLRCPPPIVTCLDLTIRLADLDHRSGRFVLEELQGPSTTQVLWIQQPCCGDSCIQLLVEHQKRVPFSFYTHAHTHAHTRTESGAVLFTAASSYFFASLIKPSFPGVGS